MTCSLAEEEAGGRIRNIAPNIYKRGRLLGFLIRTFGNALLDSMYYVV